MARFRLKRIVREEDCPGTCCRTGGGAFPLEDRSGVCKYHDLNFPDRPFGGCSLFDDTVRSATLTPEEETRWEQVCRDWPCSPDTNRDTGVRTLVQLTVGQQYGEKYTHRFGSGGNKVCDCYEWERV